jgi:hypothetical protein
VGRLTTLATATGSKANERSATRVRKQAAKLRAHNFEIKRNFYSVCASGACIAISSVVIDDCKVFTTPASGPHARSRNMDTCGSELSSSLLSNAAPPFLGRALL